MSCECCHLTAGIALRIDGVNTPCGCYQDLAIGVTIHHNLIFRQVDHFQSNPQKYFLETSYQNNRYEIMKNIKCWKPVMKGSQVRANCWTIESHKIKLMTLLVRSISLTSKRWPGRPSLVIISRTGPTWNQKLTPQFWKFHLNLNLNTSRTRTTRLTKSPSE